MYVGVDVGKDGGIVGIDDRGKIVFQTSMPVVGSSKLEYNPEKIKNVFKELHPLHVGIENPAGMEGYSKNAVASLKYCVGLFEGILVGLDIPHSLINPRSWQAKVWAGHKKVTYRKDGKDKTDTKATSMLVAQRMAPGHDFRKSERARLQHEGIMDSFLIAIYVKNNR